MKENPKKETRSKAFIQRLQKLSSGELAILRRCNRNPLEDDRLLSTLGKLGALKNYEYALIACLYAVYHKPEDRPHFIEHYNFGETFRNAYDPENKKQDTRFRAILSAEKGDALAYRLRQAVKLIKSKEGQIDFSVLLSNLFQWEKEERWVQRKWAQGYYEEYTDNTDLPDESDSEDSEEEENED